MNATPNARDHPSELLPAGPHSNEPTRSRRLVGRRAEAPGRATEPDATPESPTKAELAQAAVTPRNLVGTILNDFVSYQLDAWERSILFLDVLRQRGDNMLAHERAGNPHVGHRGIFVSAAVAHFEHRAILESLSKIEALPCGLYEIKIDNPTDDPDCRHDAYSVRFEERRVEDLKFPVDSLAFERVRNVSSELDALYSATLGPFVTALSTPLSASVLEWLHPMRASRTTFASGFNPVLGAMAGLASFIRDHPQPAADDNPFKSQERATIKAISELISRARRLRDAGCEHLFSALYGEANPSVKIDREHA